MNDLQYEGVKATCKLLFEKWRERLKLQFYEIQYEWFREGNLDRDDARHMKTNMDVLVQWEYLRAYVRVDCPLIVDKTVPEIEEIVVHEFCHILVNEMSSQKRSQNKYDHEERVVTTLTRLFLSMDDTEPIVAPPIPASVETTTVALPS